MKKKIFAIVACIALVAVLCVCFAACDDNGGERKVDLPQLTKENVKIGLICLHPGNSSTYDKNFIDAMEEAVADLGLDDDQLIIKDNIPEGPECYNTAVELVNQGCNIIFADSFGHEDYIIQAAEEFPNVRFCHATGTKARTVNLGNYYNAFASIYEGRYLAGVVAGMKLQEMITANQIQENQKENGKIKVGYVGAFTYAEVISGYTSWFLGVRSVVNDVVMKVQFTGSWYDESAEKSAAFNLIDNEHCALISQHADSMGAPTACKERGVPNVTYNVSTASDTPNTYLVGSRINWAPYYKYVVECAMSKSPIAYDYVGTLQTGSVELLDINTSAFTNAQAVQGKVNEVKQAMLNGTLDVFCVENFTVGGQKIGTNELADVVTDEAFAKDTFVVEFGANGKLAYKESTRRSAPYFDLQIDGITLLNSKF